MKDRYHKFVPHVFRRLIAEHALPRPNWFVGAAEHSSVPRDPALVAELEDVKKRLRDHRAQHD